VYVLFYCVGRRYQVMVGSLKNKNWYEKSRENKVVSGGNDRGSTSLWLYSIGYTAGFVLAIATVSPARLPVVSVEVCVRAAVPGRALDLWGTKSLIGSPFLHGTHIWRETMDCFASLGEDHRHESRAVSPDYDRSRWSSAVVMLPCPEYALQ
jgi:hypothetical protein